MGKREAVSMTYELKPLPYMEIQLTKGKVAKVSPEDYEDLNKYSWHATRVRNGSYAARSVFRSDEGRAILVYMHRQILHACDSREFEVDHINGDPLDNRRENLRLVEHRHNSMNQAHQVGRSSIYKGVYWSTDNSWAVQIKENGRSRVVHGIEDEDIAGLIYDLMALDRFKEYARFNNPDIIAAWNRRAEPDTLPGWFVEQVKESIINGRLLEDELKDDDDIEGAVATARRINTLDWVLSLKKGDV